jgi:hypothetical protein
LIGGKWPHNPSGGTERVGSGCGAEKRMPLTSARIDAESRVGAAWIPPKPDDLTPDIEIIVQFHLFPTMDAKIIAGRGVFAAKRKVTLLNRLQAGSHQGFADFVENFDMRVERATAARRQHGNNRGLARGSPELIVVGR